MVGAEAPSGLAGPPLGAPQRITILGATGSVGTSALDLIGRSPERYRVAALTAHGAAATWPVWRGSTAPSSPQSPTPSLCDAEVELSGTGIEAAAGRRGSMVWRQRRTTDCTLASIVGVAGWRRR